MKCYVCKKDNETTIQGVPFCGECHKWISAHPGRNWIFKSPKRVKMEGDRMWVNLNATLICAAFP